MSTTAPDILETGYVISEDDHLLLLQVRNQLKLLSVLSAPRSSLDDLHVFELPTCSLAESYRELHDALDAIARNAQWMAD